MEFFGTLCSVIYVLFPQNNLFYACVTGPVLDFYFGNVCFQFAIVGPSGPCNLHLNGKKNPSSRDSYATPEGKDLAILSLLFSTGKNHEEEKRRNTDFKIGKENTQLK